MFRETSDLSRGRHVTVARLGSIREPIECQSCMATAHRQVFINIVYPLAVLTLHGSKLRSARITHLMFP